MGALLCRFWLAVAADGVARGFSGVRAVSQISGLVVPLRVSG